MNHFPHLLQVHVLPTWFYMLMQLYTTERPMYLIHEVVGCNFIINNEAVISGLIKQYWSKPPASQHKHRAIFPAPNPKRMVH